MYIPSYVPTLCEGIKLLVENSPFMLRCRSREMRTCSQKASGEADPSRCQNGLKIVMLGCYVMLRPDILCQKINSTNECHVCVIHLSILSCSHTHTHMHTSAVAIVTEPLSWCPITCIREHEMLCCIFRLLRTDYDLGNK